MNFSQKNSAENDGLAMPEGIREVFAEVDPVSAGRAFIAVVGFDIGPEVFGEDETNVARVSPVKEKYFI